MIEITDKMVEAAQRAYLDHEPTDDDLDTWGRVGASMRAALQAALALAQPTGDNATAGAINKAMLEALKGVVRVADRKTVEFDAARAAIALAESALTQNAGEGPRPLAADMTASPSATRGGEPAPVPEGWQLVPKEFIEWADELYAAFIDRGPYNVWQDECLVKFAKASNKLRQTPLAAAPSPPSEQD